MSFFKRGNCVKIFWDISPGLKREVCQKFVWKKSLNNRIKLDHFPRQIGSFPQGWKSKYLKPPPRISSYRLFQGDILRFHLSFREWTQIFPVTNEHSNHSKNHPRIVVNIIQLRLWQITQMMKNPNHLLPWFEWFQWGWSCDWRICNDTVDGRNPANHLGCIKPCKYTGLG